MEQLYIYLIYGFSAMFTKNRIGSNGVLAILCASAALLVGSQVSSQIVTKSGQAINAQLSMADMSFYSGDDVTVKAMSTDDVFAAGGTVNIDATFADHLIVAGSDISAKALNVRDVFAAGGKVDVISGVIADDLVTAGGQIVLRPEVRIGGSAVISGSDVKIDAPIGAELKSVAGRLYLNSTIGGNTRLIGDNVELGPKARINGNLQYRAKTMKISPAAVIVGTKSILPDDQHSELERWGKGGIAAFAAFAAIFALSMTLLVVAIAFFLPSLMTSAATMIRERPLRALLVGFLITVLLPFLIFLLSASIIGIPLAMLIGVLFLAAVPIAVAASAYFTGMQGRRILTKKTGSVPNSVERLLWPVAAVLAFLMLGAIPFVGGLFWFLVLMFGMGAVATRGGTALAQKA